MRISDWSSDVCSSDLIFHSFRRSRCLRPAALTRWRSAGWGGGSKIDGSGAGGATREAPARASAPELAELVGQPGPVDYASGTKGRVPLVVPRWQMPPLTERGPGPLDARWQSTEHEDRGPCRSRKSQRQKLSHKCES